MTAYTGSLRGVTFGKGTDYEFAAAPTGLGVTEVRSGDINLPRQDGILAGDDYLGGRTFVFDLNILGDDDIDAEALAQDLAAAFAPSRTDLDLTFTLSDTEYVAVGRPRGADVKVDNIIQGHGRARCVFRCTDPRLFGAEVSTAISLPAGTDGLLFPAEAPFVFGALSSPGEAILNNAGRYETDWTATFTGPLTSPRIEHVELGRTLAFTGLTINTGETLELDSRAKSALLNGTASRYSSLSSTSRWWTLPVGNSTIRFRAASGSGTLEVRHRPAYL